MLQKDTSRWPMIVCLRPEDIPAGAIAIVRQEIVQQLGNPVDVMFPAFAAAFPHCVAALKTHWGVPKLVVKCVALDWIASIVLEGFQTNNIQVMLRIVEAEVEGDEFESFHRMLPEAWKELYRWFESFGLRDYPLTAGGWINTPFHYSGRLNLEQYRQRIGAKKSDVRAFEKRIDSTKFECWLLTDAGDTLWLDEQRCDQKVYHLRNGDFGDVFVLPEPAATLDAYLGHFLSGGSPRNFDFRNPGVLTAR